MGLKRKVIERVRSWYVNLPPSVIKAAGFKTGDVVDIRYVEGIGVIVTLPMKLPLSKSERSREKSMITGVKRGGRMIRSADGNYLEVIPLDDVFRHNK